MACKIIYNGKTYTEQEFIQFIKGGGLDAVSNLTSKSALQKKIKDILNGTSYALHYFGNDVDEISAKKPTEEEITEYQTLLKKKQYRSPRYKELRQKLNEWQIIDGTMDNEQNSSIADYVEMYNSIEENTNNPQQAEVTQVTESDYNTLDQVDESTERGGFDPYSSLSTPDVALAYNPPNSENKLQFSYINIETLASFFPNHEVVMLDKNGVEVPFESKKEIGTTYIFKGVDEDFQVKVVDKSRLEMEDSDFAKNAVGVKIKTSGVSAFRTVFKEGEPVKSDFELKDFSRSTANSLEKGEELSIMVDPNNEYNRQVLYDLENGKITEEEATNKLNIVMVKDGNVVGNFTAIGEKPKGFPTLDKNKAIREEALKQARGSVTPVTLSVKAKVNMTLVGNPNTRLNPDGSIIEQEISIDSLNNIVSVGTMIDKSAEGNHPKDTVFAYVNSMSTKNKGKKIPFVVIRYNNKNIAFPISIKTENIDNSQALLSIITSSLSPSQKSLKTIELLNSLKVEYSAIDFTNPEWIQSQATQELLESLKSVTTPTITVDSLKDKNQLVGNTTIGLDLENFPFFNNKILLELPEISTKEQIKKEETVATVQPKVKKTKDAVVNREVFIDGKSTGYFAVPTSSSNTPGYIIIDKRTYSKWKTLDDEQQRIVEREETNGISQEQKEKLKKGAVMKFAAEKRKLLGFQISDELQKVDVSKIQVGDTAKIGEDLYEVKGFAFGQPMVSLNGEKSKKLNSFKNEVQIQDGILNEKSTSYERILNNQGVRQFGYGVTEFDAIESFKENDFQTNEDFEEAPQEQTIKISEKVKTNKELTTEETEIYTKEEKLIDEVKEEIKVQAPKAEDRSFTVENPYGHIQTIHYKNGAWGTINSRTKEFQKEYPKNQEYFEWLYEKSLDSSGKIKEQTDNQFKKEFEQEKANTETAKLNNELNNEDCK